MLPINKKIAQITDFDSLLSLVKKTIKSQCEDIAKLDNFHEQLLSVIKEKKIDLHFVPTQKIKMLFMLFWSYCPDYINKWLEQNSLITQGDKDILAMTCLLNQHGWFTSPGNPITDEKHRHRYKFYNFVTFDLNDYSQVVSHNMLLALNNIIACRRKEENIFDQSYRKAIISFLNKSTFFENKTVYKMALSCTQEYEYIFYLLFEQIEANYSLLAYLRKCPEWQKSYVLSKIV